MRTAAKAITVTARLVIMNVFPLRHPALAQSINGWCRSVVSAASAGRMTRITADNHAVRLGIADHLGWAIAVTASEDHEVVDRRRIGLVEPGMSEAPIHYESRRLDVAATARLVAEVRASVIRATAGALDELAATLPAPVRSISLRTWPVDFPPDIAVQRRPPYEARADAIMYRQELSELAHARGWEVHLYDAKAVVDQALRVLGERTDALLRRPRAAIGPPWTKDHRIAFAATILAVRHRPEVEA